MNYHKLLSKQILKFLPENLQEDSAIRNFLSVVSESYKTLEREKYLSERNETESLKLSNISIEGISTKDKSSFDSSQSGILVNVLCVNSFCRNFFFFNLLIKISTILDNAICGEILNIVII